MNKKISERILLWLPVGMWYAGICLFSSVRGDTVSSLPSLLLNILSSADNPLFKIPIETYLFWGHRIAHFIEYSILGILIMRAYAHEVRRVTLVKILFLSVLVFASGSVDEWHQSFVPGRSPQLLDVIFDTICAALGMLNYKIFILNKKNS